MNITKLKNKIKSQRYNQLRWTQHVAQGGETRNAYGQWVEEPDGR